MSYFSIAIDGPAGAGKSTIAKQIAKRLGFIYVDTGAMYRAMALYFLRRQIDADDHENIEKYCDMINITIEYKNGEQIVLLNGENVNSLIRTEEVGNMASAVSVNRTVRLKLVQLQRQLARKNNVIMDGRDIGTVVLPNADVKIFLTASPEDRAKRRYEEHMSKGQVVDFNQLLEEIKQRDYNDSHRAIAPLKQAEDAIYVDTSGNTLEQSIEQITNIVLENLNRN